MTKKIIIFILGISFIILFFITYYKYINPNINIVNNSKVVKVANDLAVFEKVKYSGDKSKCEDITNEQLREKCISVAISLPIYKNVMTSGDINGCYNIDNIEVKKRCLDLFKGRDIRTEAILKGDINLCKNSDFGLNNEICKTKVKEFLNAVESKNIETCSRFLNKAISDECKKRILGQEGKIQKK